ncbi:FapA family protein [Borrelia miyamotoi]|uniref:FapA family protein n=1 Tax=Borrelia miyamotoi TaxID=47466 RepID=A0AAX3JM38_9SPIR|nr:FapA family protein [Borrelia miyamotoi]WAZ71967.1 FapA family protein [Borrelia miyamotoi]
MMASIVDFSDFRNKIKHYLEREKSVNLIELESDTLEEALNDASLELSVPYKDLDYEILVRGSDGLFGYGKRKWKIVAYKNSYTKFGIFDVLSSQGSSEEVVSLDGKFFIKRTTRGVFLKVTSALGVGSAVNLKDVMDKFASCNNIKDLDIDFVRVVVENASGNYEQVAVFEADLSESVTMMVHISEDSMSVTVEFTAPGPNGAEVLEKDIFNILKKYGISNRAFLKDKIKEFVDFPIYGEPVEMARGINPVKGRDSYINFIAKSKYLGEYGSIGIGNELRNVDQGEELAEIIPLSKGVNGYTIFGKILVAENGRELDLVLGENTLREGNKIVAGCDGYMSIVNGVISVHDVYVIEGDVGPGTGNIVNNGMVLVRGSVLDGYNVMAKSGIEVNGLVGRCNLKTDGSIILRSGANGKGGSEIYAKKSIRSKFLENVNVRCEGDIEVIRGIVNSYVSCKKKVLCIGKKSKIVGSYINAREEVRAYSIGSEGNAETSISVGFDPEIKDLLFRFTEYLVKIEKRLEVLMKDIFALKKNIEFTVDKADKSLKIDSCNELINERNILILEIKMVKDKQANLQEALENSKIDGKVFVEYMAYAGVKLHIKDAYYELSRDYHNITFVEDDNIIKMIAYVPFKSK